MCFSRVINIPTQVANLHHVWRLLPGKKNIIEHIPSQKKAPSQNFGENFTKIPLNFPTKGALISSSFRKKHGPQKSGAPKQIDLFRRPSRTCMSMGSPVRARWGLSDFRFGSELNLWVESDPLDPPMEGWMNLFGCFWVLEMTPFLRGFRILREFGLLGFVFLVIFKGF